MPYLEDLERSEFRLWLSKTIEPLCDADPAVLSDYIVALLKHDASMEEGEWKAFITRELIDFLETSSAPFVETLFQTLSNRSYLLPPESQPVVKIEDEVPAVVSAAPQAHPIPSGPAAGVVPAYNPHQPSVSGPAAQIGDVMMQDHRPNMAPGFSRRPKCKDYHERGYCMRGVNCHFEHSEDVLIPTPEMMFGGFFPPIMGMPVFPGTSGISPGAHGGSRGGRGGGRGRRDDRGGSNGRNNSDSGNTEERQQFQGTSRPPGDPQSTTILVMKIPPEHYSVPNIQGYFSNFGTVTSVAIESHGNRALVSFATNLEAYKAWKSDEAIFGNRHVQVLWHRPRPGQGEHGQKALEKNKALVENLQRIKSGDHNFNQGVKAKLSGPESRLQATLAQLEQREKQAKKEPLMAEQKVLLKKAATSSKEEKLAILKRLKAITRELEDINLPSKSKVDLMEVEGDDKKARLDRELAMHGMERKDDDEMDALNQQLASLKEKANTLGINSSARYSPYSTTRGGARGRGSRGRGGYNSSFPARRTLDNRSRTILVTGDLFGDQSAKQAAKEWYDGFSGISEDTADGGLRVTFSARDLAEKALSAGTQSVKDTAGPLKVVWEVKPLESQTQTLDVHMGVDTDMANVEDERRGERDEED